MQRKKKKEKHTYTDFSGMLSTQKVKTRDTYIGFKFKCLRFLFKDSCPGELKHTQFINTKFKSYSSEGLTTSEHQTRFNWMEEYPEPNGASGKSTFHRGASSPLPPVTLPGDSVLKAGLGPVHWSNGFRLGAIIVFNIIFRFFISVNKYWTSSTHFFLCSLIMVHN